jgi:hypothetical protein
MKMEVYSIKSDSGLDSDTVLTGDQELFWQCSIIPQEFNEGGVKEMNIGYFNTKNIGCASPNKHWFAEHIFIQEPFLPQNLDDSHLF